MRQHGTPLMRTMVSSTSSPARAHTGGHARANSLPVDMHWIFRSNIPRRRGHPLPTGEALHRRNFFGMSEVLGVITNPAETVRSLTESRRLLDEARREISDSRERAQLRPAHTFSRLPGFFPRPAELRAIQRILEGDPSFTVLFGASSVGKTALLREVLSLPDYHVLHFDLRIAGFADLSSLYTSLSSQMEQYFEELSKADGYKEFEKEAWGFKHDRLNVERRISDTGPELGHVKTSDVARLMELFQSALLKYWQFEPEDIPPPPESEPRASTSSAPDQRRHARDASSEITHIDTDTLHRRGTADTRMKAKWSEKLFRSRSRLDVTTPEPDAEREIVEEARQPAPAGEGDVRRVHVEEAVREKEETKEEKEMREEKERQARRPKKKVPVIFFDEAHKLPALIRSTEAMKCILDSMLVLTKQDRLCHVVHATSDPFYQTWLRQLNVMQHCKIVTVGDCSKADTRIFFDERVLPRVPEALRPGLDFEGLYSAFGGKLAHWSDYVTDYVNANGRLSVERSTHFLQAHALLNLHLIHSTQLPAFGSPERATSDASHVNVSSGAGFRIYSPLSNQDPHAAPPMGSALGGDGSEAPTYPAEFSANQLLRVMSRLAQPGVRAIPYFGLCREMGVVAVDGMVKGRILELRWTETITREGDDRPSRFRPATMLGQAPPTSSDETAVDRVNSTLSGEWVAVSPTEEPAEEEEQMVVGPLLVPTTPIMRYAMREVVSEYEDVQTVSEYASMSDGDPQEY